MAEQQRNYAEANGKREPRRVRLPGFVQVDAEVGLGDMIKRVTYSVGIRPCTGCERRAAALNRRIVFTRERTM